MHALTQTQSRADRSRAKLRAALAEQMMDLRDALGKHGETGREAAKQGTASMIAFVMEYTRESLVQAFQKLARAYDRFLKEWHTQHLTESIQLLEIIQSTLPQAHAALRAEALTLRNYHRLLLEQLAHTSDHICGYGLPALERTVELLDHLSIQFEPFNWRFCLAIEQDGVLPVGISGTVMTLSKYRERQLQAALERDFYSDVERLVCDPAYLELLAKLQELCNGASERQKAALTIWRDHGASSESD
ncbi:hypothetical protein [Halochromatium roseum]|uniref:hypothetical protein n=1 Tax=Halochromatium roseum TaxID=391920 RepID=UPI00191331E8|nr:hypothetical protein [Halochromatium roseum]MBK5938497.1 hypothetical protein [Halochromatium roseum]